MTRYLPDSDSAIHETVESKLLSNGHATELELTLLLDAIYRQYGYDFRHYARSSLLRRVNKCLERERKTYISELIPCIIHDIYFFDRFLQDMSITVTSMFRDPHIFKELNEKVIPKLSTYPAINIWHAGCATGEEVYSIAILLAEAGLLERSRIYATDYNNHSLSLAAKGCYSLSNIEQFTDNYHLAGGNKSLDNYYLKSEKTMTFIPELRKKITFAHHNLMKDGVFAEMHLVLCRNVLIYFDQTLQNRVLDVLSESLTHRGFLMLGDRESIEFSSIAGKFEHYCGKNRIYRKNLFVEQ